MRELTSVYTIQITNDNVDQIVEAFATQKWTLDHLADQLEYGSKDLPEFEALILYVTVDRQSQKIINCNDVPFYDPSHKDLKHVTTEHLTDYIRHL